MSQLGDALEAIHDSRHRFRTVRAVGLERGEVWRLWWQRPDRLRSEFEDEATVRVGSRWWHWSERHGASTDEDEGHHVVISQQLFDPRPLLAGELAVIGAGEVAHRDVVVVRARSRPSSMAGRQRGWPLAEGMAEGMDVAIDRETGVLLQAGDLEVVEVAFDAPLATSLFEPPFAAGVEAVPKMALVPQEVSLDEASARVTFPILTPRVLPEGTELSGCFLAPEGGPAWVSLEYVVDPGRRYFLDIQQGPGAHLPEGADRSRWERLTVEGVELLVGEWSGESFHTITISLRRHHVPIRIRSDLERELVVAIALSLEPL